MINIKSSEKLLRSHIDTLTRIWRKNSNHSPLSQKEISTAASAVLSLQRGLTGNRILAGSGYMENEASLGAYLLYYWPVSYLQTSYVISFGIKSLKELIENKKKDISPIRILDLGCGPGPASCALLDMITSLEENVQIELLLADTSQKALKFAKNCISSMFHTIQLNLCETDFEKEAFEKLNACCKSKKYDIIIISHALNELWKDDPNRNDKRIGFINKIATMLEQNGTLFLTEPALLKTSRDLIQIRDKLVKEGWYIIAPCTNNKNCPALSAGENTTCHAEYKWIPLEPVASIARQAHLDRESIKMTFFVMRKKITEQTLTNTNTTHKTISARIVSDGMLNKAGRIRYLLCDGVTRIPFSAKADDYEAKKQGFFNLQRYDLIQIENPENRGDTDHISYGFHDQTHIKVNCQDSDYFVQ